MKPINWLTITAATLALGCGGSSSDDGSAGSNSATEGVESGASSASDTASGTTTGTGESESGGGASSGGESDSTDTATGGETGATTGGEDDATLPFTCDGFAPTDNDAPEGVVCFYDVEDPEGDPAASLSLSSVDLNGAPAVYVRLIFAPWFVDNTYGAESIGWDGGHTFNELVGSDHALLQMGNAGEEPLLAFQLDYIEEDDNVASGFRCQGVWDGQGKMEEGEIEAVLAANSSLSRNLNERGHAAYTEDSPATDADYTPNPAAASWDYRVIYEAWVDASLFTDVDLIDACIDSIHASPAKIGDNTVDVFPDECPPGWGCYTTGECNECPPSSSANPEQSSSNCDPGDGYPPVP